MNIGKKVKKLRESIGLTQQELAKKLGVTRQKIIKIENKNEEISASMLAKISNVLGTTTDFLISSEIKKPIDFMQFGAILREYNYIDTEKLNRLLQSIGQYEVESVTTMHQKNSQGEGNLGTAIDLSVLEKGIKGNVEGGITKGITNSVTSKLTKTTVNKATDFMSWLQKNPNVLSSSLEDISKVKRGSILQLDVELSQNNFERALMGMEEIFGIVSRFSPDSVNQETLDMIKKMASFFTDQRYYHLISEDISGKKLIGLFRKDMINYDIESILGENTVVLKIQRVLVNENEKFYLLPSIIRASLKEGQLENLVDGMSGLNQFGLEFKIDDLEVSGPLVVYEPILSFK